MKQVVAWAVILALPLMAAAADKSPDESFYNDAAQGNLSEIQLGQLAQTKGQSPAVKEFGAMMVKDHGAANEKLKVVASHKGIDLPSSAGVSAAASKAKLDMMSGESFDKSYIKGMISDHKSDIEAFQKEATSGQDPDAKKFAEATLPTLQKHLKKIQSIAKDAGVSPD
jgi:putative membrane protein